MIYGGLWFVFPALQTTVLKGNVYPESAKSRRATGKSSQPLQESSRGAGDKYACTFPLLSLVLSFSPAPSLPLCPFFSPLSLPPYVPPSLFPPLSLPKKEMIELTMKAASPGSTPAFLTGGRHPLQREDGSPQAEKHALELQVHLSHTAQWGLSSPPSLLSLSLALG